MTASPDPHVGMPSEEEIARAIYHSKPRNKPWDLLTREFKNQYRKQARAILDLIRPAFEAQQAKLAQAVEAGKSLAEKLTKAEADVAAAGGAKAVYFDGSLLICHPDMPPHIWDGKIMVKIEPTAIALAEGEEG